MPWGVKWPIKQPTVPLIKLRLIYMPLNQRIRFKSTQDWHNFVNSNPPINGQQLQEFRFACYKDIEAIRGRPLLIYSTKFLDNVPNVPNFIDLDDIDGFTDLVSSVTNGGGVDVLLHSPGGRPDATERIVSILRSKYATVNFLIPHSAYSAATMLALSGNSILLHPSATLGPIDPQINGTPARSIKRGFERVKEVMKNEGPEALPAYVPLIEKYSLDLLELCDDSEKLSKELVTNWLTQYMFANQPGKERTIEDAVTFFSNYDEHLLHARPLLFSKIQKLNLAIEVVDGELQDLLWEAYILINSFFNATPFVKLYENLHGISWGKQHMQINIPAQLIQTPRPQAEVKSDFL